MTNVLPKWPKLAILLFIWPLLGVAQFAPGPMPDFASYDDVAAKKAAFIEYLLPRAEAANTLVAMQRAQVIKLQERWQQQQQLNSRDTKWLQKVATDYGIKTFEPAQKEDWDLLLRRVDVVPVSLLLAQAANESAWGTSRFAREGSNLFGQWCYKAGCGIDPQVKSVGQTHHVKRFNNPYESIKSYIHNLNTHFAYKSLREQRAKLRDQEQPITGDRLVAGLTKYSERGSDYVHDLRQLMHANKLARYDS